VFPLSCGCFLPVLIVVDRLPGNWLEKTSLFSYWLLLVCNRDKAILFEIGNSLIPVFFWIRFRRFTKFHSWFLVFLECFLLVQSNSCCFATGLACFLTGSVCLRPVHCFSVCFKTGSMVFKPFQCLSGPVQWFCRLV
jgi:hypothetical protein